MMNSSHPIKEDHLNPCENLEVNDEAWGDRDSTVSLPHTAVGEVVDKDSLSAAIYVEALEATLVLIVLWAVLSFLELAFSSREQVSISSNRDLCYVFDDCV